ncbi:MAG: hypothetical protein AAFV69_14095 [Pseudomonadota bacterium]
MQQLAPSPSQRKAYPFGLFCLRDIMHIEANLFVVITQALRNFRSDIEGIEGDRLLGKEPSSSIEELCRQLITTTELLNKEFQIPVTLAGVKRLAEKLRSDIPAKIEKSTIISAIVEVENRLDDELSTKHMMVISDHIDKTSASKTLGNEAAGAFPTSIYDIEEAGWCLALRRPTACVLHCMRGLERPLLTFASELLVDTDKTNWNAILNDVETQVRGRDAKRKPGLAVLPESFWDGRDRDFYTDATTHFFSIKNAWRNYSVHAHENYTMERALTVFSTTVEFIRHLADHFSEPSA